MGKIVKTRIKCDSRSYECFLVKPEASGDLHTAAKRLMEIESVKEVLVTEGDYGFLVRTDPIWSDLDLMGKRIAKAVGGNSRKALCYCRYSK